MSEFSSTLPQDLLTPDDEPASAPDAFDALERTILDFPDATVVLTSADPPPLGKSWVFSFYDVGFVEGGGRTPLPTYGMGTLRGWIDKCLHTARGAHPIHPPGYGMNEPFGMIGKPHDSAEMAMIEERVRDALTFHPRIADIRDFKLAVLPDEEFVNAEFTVVLDDDTTLPVGVRFS